MDRRTFLKSGLAVSTVNIPTLKLVELSIGSPETESDLGKIVALIKNMRVISKKVKKVKKKSVFYRFKVYKFWSNGKITHSEAPFGGHPYDFNIFKEALICHFKIPPEKVVDDIFYHDNEPDLTEAYLVNISSEIEEVSSFFDGTDVRDPWFDIGRSQFDELVSIVKKLDVTNKKNRGIVFGIYKYLTSNISFGCYRNSCDQKDKYVYTESMNYLFDVWLLPYTKYEFTNNRQRQKVHWDMCMDTAQKVQNIIEDLVK